MASSKIWTLVQIFVACHISVTHISAPKSYFNHYWTKLSLLTTTVDIIGAEIRVAEVQEAYKFRPYFTEKSLVPLQDSWKRLSIAIVDKVLPRLLDGDMTLSILTFSIMTFSIMTLSIKDLHARLSIYNTQHKTLIWRHFASGAIILSIIKLSGTFYNLLWGMVPSELP